MERSENFHFQGGKVALLGGDQKIYPLHTMLLEGQPGDECVCCVCVGGWGRGCSLRWSGEHTLIYKGGESHRGQPILWRRNQQNWAT